MPAMPRLINDRYEVGEVIGRGGMATVHLGRDIRLGRQVAIKVLRPELAADETFHERFQREAQAVAALNHHSVVSIYDTGEIRPQGPDGVTRPYIVMEYVPGHTLRELIHDEGIEPERAVAYTLGILDALSYSHRAGIVHRDIKPANVKVTPDGTVKVMDFGIARAVEDTQAALTQSQAVLGTAQYLSPEQARGTVVDHRSDLYSAACVLFEMLTGRAPFVGGSSVAIAAQHVRDAPPAPSALNPRLPRAVDDFMEKALAKDREYRFTDAAHMRRALRNLGHRIPDDLEATRAVETTGRTEPRTKSLPVVGAGTPPTGIVAAGRGEDGEAAPDGGDTAASARSGAHPVASDEPTRQRRTRWILVALITAVLLAGLSIAGVSGVRWWQAQQQAMVTVPQVVGMDRTTAENTLRDEGLEPTFTSRHSDEVPDRHVISMDPVSGTRTATGSPVAVVVSDGPGSVTIPGDLVGQSLDYARESLRAAGLTAGLVSTVDSPTVPQNHVVATDPGGGSTVEKNSAVELQVSTGRVTVPDVVGRTRAQAEEILRGENTRLDVDIAVRETRDAEANTVLEQSAQPGSSVAQGATITLTVARFVPPSPTSPPTTPSPTPTAESPAPSPTDDEDEPRRTPSPSPSRGSRG